MGLISMFRTGAGIIASVLLFILTVMTFIDVIGRTFLNRPLVGAGELTEIGLAVMIFVLLPVVSLSQDHISVDLIDSIAGPVLNAIRNILTGVLGAAIFGMIAWHLWIQAGRAVSYNDLTPALRLPLAPALYAIAIMSGATALAFVVLLFKMHTRKESAEMEAARRMAESAE